MSVLFLDNVNENCGRNNNNTKSMCIEISADVNGAKGPNIIGRDYFLFGLKENGLYPQGCDGTNSCGKNGNNGADCACKVLREGAMNY